MLTSASANVVIPAAEAAVQLDEAFRATCGRRLHLAPLDLSPELPSLRFGPARISKFSPDELSDLVNVSRLRRLFPDHTFDAQRFAQFHWMVVEEIVPLDQEPDARAMPLLFVNVGDDLGVVEPHKERWPQEFENALFVLLLAPWEDWSEMLDVDWRGFKIRRVYTIDSDIFVRQDAPPSPDTLSWEPDIIDDGRGGTIEDERPVKLRLADRAYAELQNYGDARWLTVEQARQSPLFETPIVHFLLRAFASEGIDEYLAHITTIEAALGLRSDHNRNLRRTPDPHKGLGATRRVGARVAALLGDARFADQYSDLFEVRSEYLHGRTMKAISTTQRVSARRLARRVVEALIGAAVHSPPPSREHFLGSLLDAGVQLVRRNRQVSP
jgi:hypothetical protein